MTTQGLYERWGLRSNPFTQTALQADETGNSLLVGRDTEVRRLMERLFDPPKAITVEGANGVGKTSIVNVAAFRCRKLFLDNKTIDLYIPAVKIFEITSDGTVDDFLSDFYYTIAQTLLALVSDGRVGQRSSDLKDKKSIHSWLNKPEVKSFDLGAAGVSLGIAKSPNTSDGFTKDGFRNLVRSWLRDLFPNGEGGGVICVVDNMELLQTSRAAKEKLEALRDSALSIEGVRWILCGASGIVRSVMSSPRLEGLLYTPIEIGGIDARFAEEVLESRINHFKITDDYYLPISIESFGRLCKILNGNIRHALSYADNYCRWVSDEDLEADAAADDKTVFIRWLESEFENASVDINREVKARAWEAFDKAVELGGTFAPGDFGQFNCKSAQALRGILVALERVDLISSSVDEDDNRRRTITLTPRGWMVHYARSKGFGTLFNPDSDAE